jgi:hypothetical protein
MFVNCNDEMFIDNVAIETVKEFRYLGIML